MTIIVPVLNRPDNVAPLVASVRAATRCSFHVRTSWTLLFVVDKNDIPERTAIHRVINFTGNAMVRYVTLDPPYPGSYARKINFGIACSKSPLLFSAADDLRFHRGWLQHAWKLLDDKIQVVGTNDLGNPRTMSGAHSTHTLFTRRYIEDVGGVIDRPPGIALNEDYPHTWTDDEFIGTARHRGVYAHASASKVEHLHWLWNKGEKDETYEIGNKGHRAGMRLYISRQHLWGGDDVRLLTPRERKRRRQAAS